MRVGKQINLKSNYPLSQNHSSAKPVSIKQQKLIPKKPSQNERISQNERVKKICALLDYPLELARQWLHQNNSTNFNSLSDEVVDGFVRSICWQWASQNGYPVEEFGHVASGSSVERLEGKLSRAVLRGEKYDNVSFLT